MLLALPSCVFWFQSTPAIAGRRIAEEALSHGDQLVSIHSGHCWPENLEEAHAGRQHLVSIHSGHCWPENQQG